ncbi:MAG: sigma 54-interacting transcriptional regulator [Pseudomonadota bacterium]
MNSQNHAALQTLDSDRTLTSLTGQVAEGVAEEALVLTIAFHPDTRRIGETAVMPPLSNSDQWSLCRLSPLFCAGESRSPLGERDLSRRALLLQFRGDKLLIRRETGSSRCRVDGRELSECCELSPSQLKNGVRLLLGHSTVLLLRLTTQLQLETNGQAPAGMIGQSAYMQGLGSLVQRLAVSNLDVLIRGETGTGKEMVANAIHRLSSRASKDIVSINMAAIPSGLAATTLFGSAKGAFTGATRSASGFFLHAQGSTLFMDEIGDTPAEVQPQLLRALQQREIQEVGGAIRKIDLRIISATDADLDDATCSFNAALRHRLAAGEVQLLPLRDHPEDIGDLAWHFLQQHAEDLGSEALLPDVAASAATVAFWANVFYRFLGYQWPGNVRELSNAVSQILMASTDKLSLPTNVVRTLTHRHSSEMATDAVTVTSRRALREVPESEFLDALHTCEYEVAKVARRLRVSRQAVYRRLHDAVDFRLASQVPEAELEQVLTRHDGDTHAAALDLKVSASGLRMRLRTSSLAWH